MHAYYMHEFILYVALTFQFEVQKNKSVTHYIFREKKENVMGCAV